MRAASPPAAEHRHILPVANANSPSSSHPVVTPANLTAVASPHANDAYDGSKLTSQAKAFTAKYRTTMLNDGEWRHLVQELAPVVADKDCRYNGIFAALYGMSHTRSTTDAERLLMLVALPGFVQNMTSVEVGHLLTETLFDKPECIEILWGSAQYDGVAIPIDDEVALCRRAARDIQIHHRGYVSKLQTVVDQHLSAEGRAAWDRVKPSWLGRQVDSLVSIFGVLFVGGGC